MHRSLLLTLALASAASAQIAPLRQPGEFEPARGTLVAWPLNVPLELCVELAEDDELVTLVQDAGAQAAAQASPGLHATVEGLVATMEQLFD
jgi:hypothetical protein